MSQIPVPTAAEQATSQSNNLSTVQACPMPLFPVDRGARPGPVLIRSGLMFLKETCALREDHNPRVWPLFSFAGP